MLIYLIIFNNKSGSISCMFSLLLISPDERKSGVVSRKSSLRYVCLHKEDKKGKHGHRSCGMYCHSGMLAMVELFLGVGHG
jgi:hypothetical protein